jgi:ribosomal protein L28
MPNLQSIRVQTDEGVKRMRVCTSCIQANKIQKPAIN